MRAAGAAHLAPRLLELGIPVLASWQAKDLVDNSHAMYFGSPGIYGSRLANKVFATADHILAIGNRMAIWNVGYEGPRPDQRVTMADVDAHEPRKFQHVDWIDQDAREFIEDLLADDERFPAQAWVTQCALWRAQYPTVESPAHDDSGGFINSYRFMDALNSYLRPDEIITIDCGSFGACAFQTLRVKPPQRLLSSGGLGEMGCALPAAIGASFARNKGEVLCITGDGGLMLNLQELQTIVHHRLPVKIIVAANDGYLMLKHTQIASGMKLTAVDAASGVSCPKFQQLAYAFGISATSVRTWEDFNSAIPSLFAHDGPALLEYHMHPLQPCVPKLTYRMKDGVQVYDKFDEMSPHMETPIEENVHA